MEEQGTKNDERRASAKGQGWGRIFTYYQPKIFAFIMLITSGLNALSFPALGFCVARIQLILIEQAPDWKDKRDEYCLYFLILCLAIGLISGIEKTMFAITGENLTFNVRLDLMRGILFKQVAWFDQEKHAPGILTTVLSEDVTALNGMTTETISVLVEAFVGLILGLIIAMFFSWRMALFTIAASPVMIIGVVAMSRLQWGNKKGKSKQENDNNKVDVYEKSNALLSDVIINYRTVIGLGQKNVDGIVTKFQLLLVEPARKKVRNAHFGGFFFGYSNCARILFLGIVFYIASWVVRTWTDEADDVYLAIWILFSTCMGAGVAMSNVPSVSKAKASAQNIFQIIDTPSLLDVREQDPNKQTQISKGEIVFKDVNFTYPMREKLPVLSDFNMKIEATKKIALVGHSGCGKSTITNLLLRFYNINSGKIEIDGIDLNDYDIKSLRRQIGFVMQEPVLFNTSIKENILYGELDASDEQVLKVAEMANALTFIESNVEDLTKDERSRKNADDLNNLLKQLTQTKPDLGKIETSKLTD